jgi:Rrf2 family protein
MLKAEAIAQAEHIPLKYLLNILNNLRQARIVNSQRGSDGGYTLARPPAEIAVGEVLRAADGPLAGVRGQRPEETVYDGAAVHLQELWIAVRAAVRRVLDEVSLAEVARGRLPAHVRRLIADQEAWQPR